jgi:hypothetical protein
MCLDAKQGRGESGFIALSAQRFFCAVELKFITYRFLSHEMKMDAKDAHKKFLRPTLCVEGLIRYLYLYGKRYFIGYCQD